MGVTVPEEFISTEEEVDEQVETTTEVDSETENTTEEISEIDDRQTFPSVSFDSFPYYKSPNSLKMT